MSDHRRRPPAPDRRLPDAQGGGEWFVSEYGGESGKQAFGTGREGALRGANGQSKHGRTDGSASNGGGALNGSASNGGGAAKHGNGNAATYGPATTYGRGAEPAPPVQRARNVIRETPEQRSYPPHHPGGPVPGGPVPGGPVPGGPAPGGPIPGPATPGGPGGPPEGPPGPRGPRGPAPPPKRQRWIDYPRDGKRGVRRWLPSWRLVSGIAIACVLSLMLAFVWIYQHTELPDSVNAFLDRQASIVYYADGKTELTRLGETNREEINIADMPLHLREAVIAAENKTFYTDKGFSPTGIARAVINNLRGGDTQGGSTITQQYAKLAFTDQEQTISRKIDELFLSMKLEETYTKDQILQDYLNAVYLGRGAYGVQAAAKVYFKKPANELSVEEAAVLAALLRSPERLYSPDKSEQSLQALQTRWGWVLDQMVETGALAADARAPMVFPEIAKFEPRNRKAGPRGYLIAQVERELRAAGVSDEVIQNGGLRIQTTIDRSMQKAAEIAVRENRQKEDSDNVHVALVAVEPGTGAIRASYGGADFLKDNVDDVFQAQIPPGSAFKAFGIAAALSDANNLSLERNALDGNSPYRFRDDSDPVDNCCDGSDSDYGQVSILKATERSINTAFVDLATKLLDGGTKDVVDAAHAAGITTDLVANARTVIGYQDVHVIEMANAYATFAAGGVAAPAHIIEKATYADGSPVDLGRPEPKRAFTDVQAAGVQYALRQPVEGAGGTSVKARDLGRPVAGKTGTHQDFSAWFVGFTPNQLAAAVAIYRDDRNTANDKESLDGYGGRSSVTGNSFPLDTWLTFMQAVLKDQPVTDFLPYDDTGREVVNPFPAQEPSDPGWEPPGHNRPPDPPGND